jgi:asparagine N-glycosylation enzyme membrane subunit Stt3
MASGPGPTPPQGSHSSWDAGALLTVINGVLAGIGSVYVTTRSIVVTSIACCAAVLLAGLILVLHREGRGARSRGRRRDHKRS